MTYNTGSVPAFLLPECKSGRHFGMTEESKQFLKKADHALEVAEALMSDGYPSDAASKINSRAGGNAQAG